MKKIMILGAIALSGLAMGCTVNMGSPNTNTAAAPADNKTAANQTTSPKTDAPAKRPETSTAKPATSDKSERVQFGSGKTDGSWTRDIPAGGAIDFVIGAKKGQTMGYEVGYDFNDKDVEAFLTEPGSQDISQQTGPKERNEFAIAKNGDHHLRVTNTTNKKITITLYLDIE